MLAINDLYGKKQDELFERYSGLDVILPRDGHADSLGHSARIVTKSPNMECIGSERALDLVRIKVNLTGCIVTDAHPKIAALLKKSTKYEPIRHQWDIRHGCKNLMKKVSNASQQMGCEKLQTWIPQISNHFWYSAKTCRYDAAKLAGNLNWPASSYSG